MSDSLRTIVSKIVDDFKDKHIKSFYASSIIDSIDYDGSKKSVEREVIRFLMMFVNEGLLEKKYIIFNPENPREKKVYNSAECIPINDIIEFDFNDVFIDSLDDSLIEIFFAFKNTSVEESTYSIKNTKRHASLSKKGGLSGAFVNETPPSPSENLIDKNFQQNRIIFVIAGDINMKNINNQNFTGNNIAQAGGQIENNGSNISFKNTQPFDEELKVLINNLAATNNPVIDDRITELKNNVKGNKIDLSTLKTMMTNLTDMAKAAAIVIPAADKIMNLLS